MPIKFYCENCKKKVKAPDDSAGKYGSCPYCKHRCYIPRPRQEEEDELKLSPMDDSEETRYEQLLAESTSITENILQETRKPSTSTSEDETDERELTKNIIVYLRQMADGELEDAQSTADKIVPYREQAIKILDRMATSEIPEPEVADVEGPLLHRLIKNLRTRLS